MDTYIKHKKTDRKNVLRNVYTKMYSEFFHNQYQNDIQLWTSVEVNISFNELERQKSPKLHAELNIAS